MKKKTCVLTALGLIGGAITLSSLSGCAISKKNIGLAENQASDIIVNLDESALEDKIFNPHEHIFFKRYYLYEMEKVRFIQSDQFNIDIPEGYEILTITNVTDTSGYVTQDFGFDIWFINNQTVKASPIYNSLLDKYDYSNPGIVVDKSLSLKP